MGNVNLRFALTAFGATALVGMGVAAMAQEGGSERVSMAACRHGRLA